MNRRLFELCAELTDEQRRQDLGAFFHSLHGTLNHLLLVDRLWLAVAHLFNHQTHHRGQLTTLLHQLGHDPGVTDFMVMAFLPESA